MKKVFLYFISAILGIAMGVCFHCTFMTVKAEGCMMLPLIEPGQRVVVNLLEKDIQVDDVVAFRPPYYTIDGEGNIIFRRVSAIDGNNLVLSCDTSLAEEEKLEISLDDILGKVVFPLI